MELIGTLIQVLPIETGQGKKGTWEKQGFILQTEGQYPKKVHLSVWGQKIHDYDLTALPKNQRIKAHIEIESREYSGKWYTEARAWKLEYNNQPLKGEPASDPLDEISTSGGVSDGPTDDLPF